MSKQVSQARIEANRRNGQNSTGPRTPEGKARSSRNALTHGLLSESSPVLSSSRSAAIGPVTDPNHAALVNALIAEFHPSGTIETALVATLASVRHRLNRITAIESGIFENSMTNVLEYHKEFAAPGQETINDCLDAPIHSLLGEAYGRQSRTLNPLTFYEARLNREFHRALTELRRTQTLRFQSTGAGCEIKSREADAIEQPLAAAGPIEAKPPEAETAAIEASPSQQDPAVASTTPGNEGATEHAEASTHAATEKEQTNPTDVQHTEIARAHGSHPPPSTGEAATILKVAPRNGGPQRSQGQPQCS